jgi:hypothetical protein
MRLLHDYLSISELFIPLVSQVTEAKGYPSLKSTLPTDLYLRDPMDLILTLSQVFRIQFDQLFRRLADSQMNPEKLLFVWLQYPALNSDPLFRRNHLSLP